MKLKEQSKPTHVAKSYTEIASNWRVYSEKDMMK